jgi:RNA polymerase sigma factor (sigma-70 family)
VEVSTLNNSGTSGLRGPTPLLRLQSDERLVTLTRRGNQAAYEALVARYQSRLLAFCRHMLGSKEDAEDVLQEVFAASYSALMSDDRTINVRPWFYRIARNRSLNHLRRKSAVGVDSMDVHLADHGTTTADRVHQREEFRLLMGDVHDLAETQRTALLLREIDNLSYDQIAEAMDTTVSSVKSLLVRARVSLAEAAEARAMPCEECRSELAEVAEGLRKLSPIARRHCRECERCGAFRDHLKRTNKTLALMLPVAPFLLVKKLFLAHLGTTASASTPAAVAAGTASATGAGAGGLISASVAGIASKTAAGLAAAAIVTAGAVEVDRGTTKSHHSSTPVAEAIAPAAAPPVAVASVPQPTVSAPVAPKVDPAPKTARADVDKPAKSDTSDKPATTTTTTTETTTTTTATTTTPVTTTTTSTTPTETVTSTTTTPTDTTETGGDTTVLPSAVITDHDGGTTGGTDDAPPVGSKPATYTPPPAPPVTKPTATTTTPSTTTSTTTTTTKTP